MKKFLRNFTGIYIIFFALTINCTVNNIASTYSILHDNYKYLSLVHGAVAWETGTIRQMYDIGQIFPIFQQDKQGRYIITGYDNIKETDPIIRLIHLFFYRVPGSTGETDFNATTQFLNKDPIIVAQT